MREFERRTREGDTVVVSTSDDLFLPEPEPREVRYTVISVDDHLVEPPHMFEGRLPRDLQERAPHVVEDADGHQSWEFRRRAVLTGGHERHRWPSFGGQEVRAISI